ncbi:single-stranded DNA-binding protein [uncultured Fretibacterium sp.]|uniref:single-stranded DNA-binding protein n=1 Tax=uncultured Fretibacterium sp. TaxID=1678694 RepID=UPI00263363CB|nr:single-stranded DNA-binding protein [uncultured Fretibacterium sp.]
MKGYNRVTLMGNLTRDPEVRYTQNGMACARFSLAVGYSKKKQDGLYEDAADFPTCVVWGKRAEVIGKHFRKGSGILVEGKIQTGSYQDKNGNKRYTTDVLVQDFNFVGGKKDGQDSGGGYAPHPQGHSGGWGKDDDFPMDFAEAETGGEADIPF